MNRGAKKFSTYPKWAFCRTGTGEKTPIPPWFKSRIVIGITHMPHRTLGMGHQNARSFRRLFTRRRLWLC